MALQPLLCSSRRDRKLPVLSVLHTECLRTVLTNTSVWVWVCGCGCVCVLDLLTYFANDSDGADVRRPAPPWAEAPDCNFAVRCLQWPRALIQYFCCPIFALTSPAVAASVQCLRILVLALLWQSVGSADRGAFPVIKNEDGQMGPSAKLVERIFSLRGP